MADQTVYIGNLIPQGPVGPQGPKGDKGDKGDRGVDGVIGHNGYTFTPSVSTTGDLTWTKTQDEGGKVPDTINIKGPKGDNGIPGPSGHLNTNNTNAQIVQSNESLSGNVLLHKISKTGNYADLNNKPTIPTNNKDLTNGAGYITSAALPTKVSQLTNDKNYITKALPYDSTVNSFTYMAPASRNVWSSPIANWLWHDITAFGGKANHWPTYETCDVNGNWTVTKDSYERNFFINKEDVAHIVINDTHPKVRWTWTQNISWSNIEWAVIGIGWVENNAAVDIIFYTKTASDSVWTEKKRINTSAMTTPIWISIPSVGGDSCFRIEIARTNGAGHTKSISSIKLLSKRWGDQGAGSEYAYPYKWDADKNISDINNLSATSFTENGTSLINKYILQSKEKDLIVKGIHDRSRSEWIFIPDYSGANATSNKWLCTFQREGNNVYLKATESSGLPISTATQTALNNKLGKTEAAAKTTGTLTITQNGANISFNGSDDTQIEIPNDEIIFSPTPSAEGQILRSIIIDGQKWVLAGLDNKIGVTYDEIK